MLAFFLRLRVVPDVLLNPFAWIFANLYRRYEQQMEKFKACEKEMKTKAFSKEGLIQAAKLDPKEQEKEEAIQWVNHQVEELQMQVEQTEAEVEALQGAGKKRNKGGQNAGRQEELEHLNERRKWHIGRLEIVLRMLNNGSLPLEKMKDLKEDVGFFVESNMVCGTKVLMRGWSPDAPCSRTRTLTKMRASMMNSISTRKKRNSVWSPMMRAASRRTKSAKVGLVSLLQFRAIPYR